MIFKVGDKVKAPDGTRVFTVGEIILSKDYGNWWNAKEAIGAHSMRRMSEYVLITETEKDGGDKQMSDNVAVLDGYKVEVVATCSEHDLYLLVKPDTDFESTFKAWDTDNQEFIRVNGWLYSIDFPQKPQIAA